MRLIIALLTVPIARLAIASPASDAANAFLKKLGHSARVTEAQGKVIAQRTLFTTPQVLVRVDEQLRVVEFRDKTLKASRMDAKPGVIPHMHMAKAAEFSDALTEKLGYDDVFGMQTVGFDVRKQLFPFPTAIVTTSSGSNFVRTYLRMRDGRLAKLEAEVGYKNHVQSPVVDPKEILAKVRQAKLAPKPGVTAAGLVVEELCRRSDRVVHSFYVVPLSAGGNAYVHGSTGEVWAVGTAEGRFLPAVTKVAASQRPRGDVSGPTLNDFLIAIGKADAKEQHPGSDNSHNFDGFTLMTNRVGKVILFSASRPASYRMTPPGSMSDAEALALARKLIPKMHLPTHWTLKPRPSRGDVRSVVFQEPVKFGPYTVQEGRQFYFAFSTRDKTLEYYQLSLDKVYDLSGRPVDPSTITAKYPELAGTRLSPVVSFVRDSNGKQVPAFWFHKGGTSWAVRARDGKLIEKFTHL